ncbi:MAG: hypothetical protein RIR48_2681, partial [Bacteroidota bacterium]
QIKEVRGNVYLDLVHHDESTDEVTAQISANIWYKSYLFLKNKLGALLPSLLAQGTNISIKVQVEFSEKYGMKLIIEDLDPAYTIGQMEMKRQKILQQLSDEGLMHLNKLKELPRVIQNIAVVSSPKAAGYIDFVNHLADNTCGYRYNIQLFEAALQGLNTEKDVCNAFQIIHDSKEYYDCILIIRGGGSKPDLAWFDNYNIGTAIAKSKLPVITGIGHDVDSTVADSVAFQSLKTPTAVADFLIEHNLDFESSIIETSRWITQIARQMIKNQEVTLASMIQIVRYLPADILRKHQSNIDFTYKQIIHSAKNKVKYHLQQLDLADQQIRISDPQMILRRGYAIVRQNNKIIGRARQFDVKKDVEIQFSDAIIKISTHE